MTTFNNLTLDNIPFVKLEIDNSLASLSQDQPYRVLLLGESSNPITTSKPVRIGSTAEAGTNYGINSPLFSMIKTFFDINKSTPLYVFPFTGAALETPGFKVQIETLKTSQQFNLVVSQWSDPAKIAELGKLYDTLGQADFGIDGTVFAAVTETYEELLKYNVSNTVNFKFVSIMASPTISTGTATTFPAYLIAVNTAAIVAIEAEKDPARPFNGLELSAVPSFNDEEGFTRDQLKSLVKIGFSVYSLSSTGEPRIERLVTTWIKDENGLPDRSYSDLNTILISSYLRFSFVNYFSKKYVSQRYKIADDSTLIPPGKPILQPKMAKAEAINLFQDWQERGLVEDASSFINSLIVEKKDGTIIFAFKANYIDQLIGVAGKLFFTR